MSAVTQDRWTCPSCGGTVLVRSSRARAVVQRQPCPHGSAAQVSRTGHPA